MFLGLSRFFSSWIEREPIAIVLILVTAVLLFAITFLDRSDRGGRIWLLAGRLISSLAVGLAFFGLLLLFDLFLESNYSAFNKIYASYPPVGSKLQGEWRKALAVWEGSIAQTELSVTHFAEHTETEPVAQSDGSILYYDRTTTEEIAQESITGFHGFVEIQRLDRPVRDPLYNAFTLTARYEYDVVNQSDVETRARFNFPLPNGHTFEDFSVAVDGRELTARSVASSSVLWEIPMQPHQYSLVVVRYRTRGMEQYDYLIKGQQVIQNLTLTFSVNTRAVSSSVFPPTEAFQNVVTPTETGLGETISWNMTSQAIMSPRINVWIWPAPRPYQSSGKVIQLVRITPQAFLYFMVLVAMTLLICGIPVDLRRLVLLAAIFCVQFLGLMGAAIWFRNIALPMGILSPLALALVYLLYRRLPRLPLAIILVLTALFNTGYPFAGFLPDGPQRNSFDGIIQAAMILYLFGLTLYVRIRKKQTA